MSSILSAMLGTAIFDAARGPAAPVVSGSMRAVDLLARVAGGGPVTIVAVANDAVSVNGEVLPTAAPGVDVLLDALESHRTLELHLPAGMLTPQWEALAALYATPPELWSDANGMGEALSLAVPGATLIPRRSGVPGLTRPSGETVPAADGGDRRTGMEQLRRIVREAGEAAAARDWTGLARSLGELDDFAAHCDRHLAPVVADERSRILTPVLLADLVRELSLGGPVGTAAGRALNATGEAGVHAVMERLASGPPRAARRICVDWLVASPLATPMLLHALTRSAGTLLRDAAEIAGRRGDTAAVELLAPLLGHASEEVRTASWRALENIGTPAAIEALQRQRWL